MENETEQEIAELDKLVGQLEKQAEEFEATHKAATDCTPSMELEGGMIKCQLPALQAEADRIIVEIAENFAEHADEVESVPQKDS